MSASVLKEFLVKIGFSVDEAKYRRFSEVMQSTTKRAVEMGKATIGASVVMGAGLAKIGEQLESLYYASKRTGASAAELKEFAFAAEQIGVSAEQAQGAVENLAQARRMNPGLNGLLANLGIDPRQTDNAKVLVELLGKLRGMNPAVGARYAEMFGIDPRTFQMLEMGLPEMQKYIALREKMFKAAGINPDQMTKRGHDFMVEWRTLSAAVGNLVDIMAYRLMPWGEKVIGWLETAVDWLTRADKATDGWSSKILGVVSAFGGFFGIKGAVGLLGKTLGRAGIGAAAGEAAEAGGAGLLGTLGLPALIVAVVAAVVGYLVTHPEQVKKAWDWTKNEAKALPDQLKGLNAKGEQVMGDLAKRQDFLGSVARTVQGFEGFRKRVYKDIADNATWGFGHKLKPGENMAGKDPSAVFAQDLQESLQAVAKYVRVKLTDNQRKALASLEYNIGSDAFAKSTLLRRLNAGDYSGAADQFAAWNKITDPNSHLKVISDDLVRRRGTEAQMFRTPDKGVTINQETNIHIDGKADAGATGRETARQQQRVNADMVRNLAGAVQ